MKTTRNTILISLTILLLCGIPTISTANELIFEGTLNNAEGHPVADGSHFFDFTIFTAPAGGTALWAESHNNVNIEQGHYSIILGSRTTLDLPAGTYWVETTVDGEVLQPRAKVLLADGDCTITGNLMVDGSIGVGTASPNELIEVNGGNSEAGFRAAWGPQYPLLYGEFKSGGSAGLIINSRAGGGWADINFQTEGDTKMFIERAGAVGIGTASPTSLLHIYSQTAGGTLLKVHGGDFVTEHALVVFGSGKVGIGRTDATHLLHVGASGAYCDGGAWVNGSSRSFKENITDLSSEEALDALANLQPTSFNYKTNSQETFLGFIAEDVPDIVATNDRKGLVAMDIVAVLTKVVQTQQEQIRVLEESIEALHASPAN